ncbi:Predicted secretion system X protein GspG-like 2 [Janthinobacterium sp. CG23_2]|nr:type II secretion system protein [Massilia sp. H27-R4]MCY0915791.1 type II secretion system protein [Massilia sp. H27-R4]CUI06165.1 Predicted secretion system X protein GspG-like 2 [Janthinobacterium sp. CG23_2]CUU29951.1 Predicted secretion system X protein GspG-like 2 [Janthinobacterium sp. CG23_2]
MNMRREHKGFTLVELLVVMAIIATLLTIAVPRYFGSVDKSKEVALKENLHVLRLGIDKFYGDKGVYPASLSELVTYKYFRAVPVDPVTESSVTWQPVASIDPDKPGVADIRSGARGKTREGVPYEQL